MRVEVTEAADPRLADYVRLRDVSLRRHLETEQGLFIAEGDKVIRRALEAGYRPRSFLLAERWLTPLADLLAQWSGVPAFVVAEALAEQVTGFHVHRGALAALHRETRYATADLLDGSRIAVLEDFVDHTNVGACFRSAAAMGVDAVLVTPQCADPFYRRSVKVSMGTVFQVPWTRIEPWPDGVELLKEAGYVVVGMTLADDAITLDELVAANHPRLALIFGTEGHGLSARASQSVDWRVRIPMAGGVDSLNVAAAAAVAFYATR